MKKLNRIINLFLFFLPLMIFLPFYCFAQSEGITLQSFFPTPFGNYDEVHADKLAVGKEANFVGTDPVDSTEAVLRWGTKRSALKSTFSVPNYGSSIELGGVGSQPYIDFSNDNTSDYTVRLYLNSLQELIFSAAPSSSSRIIGLETCDRVFVTGDPETVCAGATVMSGAVPAGVNYGVPQAGYIMCCRCSCDASSPGCGC